MGTVGEGSTGEGPGQPVSGRLAQLTCHGGNCYGAGAGGRWNGHGAHRAIHTLCSSLGLLSWRWGLGLSLPPPGVRGRGKAWNQMCREVGREPGPQVGVLGIERRRQVGAFGRRWAGQRDCGWAGWAEVRGSTEVLGRRHRSAPRATPLLPVPVPYHCTCWPMCPPSWSPLAPTILTLCLPPTWDSCLSRRADNGLPSCHLTVVTPQMLSALGVTYWALPTPVPSSGVSGCPEEEGSGLSHAGTRAVKADPGCG